MGNYIRVRPKYIFHDFIFDDKVTFLGQNSWEISVPYLSNTLIVSTETDQRPITEEYLKTLNIGELIELILNKSDLLMAANNSNKIHKDYIALLREDMRLIQAAIASRKPTLGFLACIALLLPPKEGIM